MAKTCIVRNVKYKSVYVPGIKNANMFARLCCTKCVGDSDMKLCIALDGCHPRDNFRTDSSLYWVRDDANGNDANASKCANAPNATDVKCPSKNAANVSEIGIEIHVGGKTYEAVLTPHKMGDDVISCLNCVGCTDTTLCLHFLDCIPGCTVNGKSIHFIEKE